MYRRKCIPFAPHQITAALVTLQSETPIGDICDSVAKTATLRGKSIIVKPAYVSKIQEIKQLVKDNLTNARDPPPAALAEPAPAPAPVEPAEQVQEGQDNAETNDVPPPPASSSDRPTVAAT